MIYFENPIPVLEFEWPSANDIGRMYVMNCVNHLDLRWSSKHMMYRSIHYLGLATECEFTKENSLYLWRECECPLSDLRVIGKEN